MTHGYLRKGDMPTMEESMCYALEHEAELVRIKAEKGKGSKGGGKGGSGSTSGRGGRGNVTMSSW